MKTAKALVYSLLASGLIVFNATISLANPGPADATKSKSPALDLARQLNQAFIEVADRVSPAVVVITVSQKAGTSRFPGQEDSFWDMLPREWRRYFEENMPREGERGQNAPRRSIPSGRGSGIVITEDGYILTNNHVVEDADKITVSFSDGKEYSAEIKGRDPRSDLAVIRLKDLKGLSYAKLGDSSAARVGEFVLAIGAPLMMDHTVTVGHISAKGRVLPEIAQLIGPYADQDFIQTDASINPGNSGGPLVNLYGEVIGINTAIRGIGTGIGFAVPSNIAKQVADHLIKEGKFTRSRIGIQLDEVNALQDFKTEYPTLPAGVLVRAVFAGGPAAKSDLKAGDIVTAVDNKNVKTFRELKEQISYKKPGDTVTLNVVRLIGGGKTKNLSIKVKTEAIPETDEELAASEMSPTPFEESGDFGLVVKGLTKQLAEEFDIDTSEGVIVTEVKRDSVAEEKGMQAGDVITEVNRQPVTTLKQFRDAMKSANKKKGVILNYITKGTSRFTVLKEE